MIYLDYAANTKVDKEVLDLYYEIALNNYGNPNSNHHFGKISKKMIEDATNKIAQKLNILPEEIIYTSGATESNNLAIKGICERYKRIGKHILTTNLEHSSIYGPLEYLEKLLQIEPQAINAKALKNLILKKYII